jgi:hypothetical protein
MVSNKLLKIRVVILDKRVDSVVHMVGQLKHEIKLVVRHWVSLRPEFKKILPAFP